MSKDFTEEIENSRRSIAKCLNLLETARNELDYVHEQNPDWNPEINWQIEEAACNLGFSLAKLSALSDGGEYGEEMK